MAGTGALRQKHPGVTRPVDGAAAAPAFWPGPPELAQLWTALGIDPLLLAGRALALHTEALHCVPADRGSDGREFLLAPPAARAWAAMKAAAAADQVALELVSAYRSVERQAQIIREHLAAGRRIDLVLQAVAPPGCSEHHTGRAVDIGTPGQAGLEEDFERTAAYPWLQQHAAQHGFSLSYPRGNAEGFVYEPWHWCWHAQA
jgi:zinc D-Ala-D-Ala carboxypeptidase